jgi:putative transcriptional regulator
VNFENTKRPVVDDRPIDALLGRYAARTLEPPWHALIQSHLDMKPDNRSYVAALEAAHGIFLAELDPVPLTGRDRRLVNIFSCFDNDMDDGCQRAPDPLDRHPEHSELPSALRRYVGCDLSGLHWRPVRSGVEQAVIDEGPFGQARFVRCRPSNRCGVHGHSGLEAILVIQGGFSDEHARYGAGDVLVSDETYIHQPIVGDAGLICFVVSADKMKVPGPIARLIEQVFGCWHVTRRASTDMSADEETSRNSGGRP